MSALKRVVLTEKSDVVTQNVVPNDEITEQNRQANNFDTDYTDQKLNDLYKEFDSITVNETDLLNDTQTLAKDEVKMSVKAKIRLTAGIVIAALLVFLAIYNIFVINDYKMSIESINGDIATNESVLENSVSQYNALTDTTDIEIELESEGYTDMNSFSKVRINTKQSTNRQEPEVNTNWWDRFCSFIASIFGR